MRKILSITAAILVLLFVSFWGFMQYRRNVARSTPIRKDAAMVLRVDVYDIYKSLLRDYFTLKKSRQNRFAEGLGIPADIFIYNLQGWQPTTLFATLPVEDSAALGLSLQQHTRAWRQVTLPATAGMVIRQSPDKTWTLAYTGTTFALAWSPQRENTAPVLAEILQQKNTVALKDSRLSGVNRLKGHITFTDGSCQGRIDFERGFIRGEAIIPAPALVVPDMMQYRRPASDAALRMWCLAGTDTWLRHKTFTLDSFSLQGDSLLAAGVNGIELAVCGSVIQRDTVISYAYNDDFEKVATVTIKEDSVPGIYATVHGNGRALAAQLQQCHWLRRDSGIVNPAVFPLYRLYAQPQSEGLLIGTVPRAPVGNLVPTTDFFNLFINFGKLAAQKDFAILKPYTRSLKQLDASASLVPEQKVQVKARLQLQDPMRHALLQLLAL